MGTTVNGEEGCFDEHLRGKTMDGHEHAREIGVLLFQAVNLHLVLGGFGLHGGVIMVNEKCVPDW